MKATRKLVALFSAAVLALAAKAAAPSVVVNSVTPAYPYGTSVQTTYTVTAGDEGYYSLKFYATINNEVYDVTDSVTPSADLLAAGEHTVTWTAPSNKLDTNAGLALKVVETGAAAGPETVAELKTYSDGTFATKTELGNYLTTAAAATTYQQAGSYVTTTDAASTYLTKTDADSTYQTKGNYLTAHQDISGKADKATTLAGYGITDAATSTQLNNLTTTVNGKADKATTLSGYGITDAYTMAEVDSAIAAKADATALPSAVEGTYMIVDLKTGGVAYEKALSSAQFNTDEYKTTKMAFRKVPAGNYAVKENNATARTATMANDYYIGVFPVTVAQYALMNNKDAAETAYAATAANMKPQATVSWKGLRGTEEIPETFGANICPGVISNLNDRTGMTFDLPTEAMWEVAARAMPAGDDSRVNWQWYYGTTATDWKMYCFGSGNADRDMLGTTSGRRVVGSRIPNDWGLYDMYGNVWEWCLDGSKDGDNAAGGTMSLTQAPNTTDTARRRIRGGGYDGSGGCSSWYRRRSTVDSPNDSFGFRLARIVQ